MIRIDFQLTEPFPFFIHSLDPRSLVQFTRFRIHLHCCCLHITCTQQGMSDPTETQHHPLDPEYSSNNPNHYNTNDTPSNHNDDFILDFTTLLPTPQQIETFNNPSTGNTPTSSRLDGDSDTYSPPMSASSLGFQPEQPLSGGARSLVKWFDSPFAGMHPARRLESQDCHEVRRSFTMVPT